MVGGGPFNLPAGAWTDDTSMALCLANSLLERGKFDATDQRGGNDIAGHPYDKQIPQALIENDFDGYARIGTSQDRREWFLPCR